jgi:UDP-glucose 4-epimerase
MKKILITGVAGMIGSHLLDELLATRDYEIIGIDNFSFGHRDNIKQNIDHPNFKFYTIDIFDIETLKILARDVDTIVHLAAVKKIDEKTPGLPTLTTNVTGTENIFKVAAMWNCKVVFASTSDVYGMSPDLPFREDGDLLLGPSMIKRWAYAVSKLYGEQLAFAYYKDEGVPTVIIRYFGGYSNRSKLLWSGGHIPIFIDAVLNDKEIPIHGDGLQTRSMAFITDIVDGTIKAMEIDKAVGAIINLGTNQQISVIDSAKIIHKVAKTGKELKIKYIPLKDIFGDYKDIEKREPDLTNAKLLLGYEPKISFEDGVTRTINTMKELDNNAV